MQITTDISQIKDLIALSQKVLIITKREPSVDGIGSMLALANALEQQEKTITCLSEDFTHEKFAFLPEDSSIQNQLSPKSLIVSIDLKGSTIEKINYETKDGRLDLIITPKQGQISAESIEFFETNLNFDLVIILDAHELRLLGNIASNHAQGFEKVPTLNIDAGANNTQFGKINFIDEDASSTAEILFILLQELDLPVSKDSATALLAGIIEKTNGFKENVSAQTFDVASKLIQLGANLEVINKNLFKETPEVKPEISAEISPLIR